MPSLEVVGTVILPSLCTHKLCGRHMRHRQTVPQTLVILFVVTTASVEANDSDWQPIECVSADLPAEAVYESVKDMDDFEATVDMMGALHRPAAEIELSEIPSYVLGNGIVTEF